MTIETQSDLSGLQAIGRVVALTLKEMSAQVRPGITTGELDAIGAALLAEHGARSAPQLTYDYPGATCISLNNQAAHGIPGDRVIQPGDLVNIDVSAELNGFWADTAATVPVPPISRLARRLIAATRQAQQHALDAARAGRPLNAIGRAVEQTARKYGFAVIRDLPGHGVGRSLHEEPTVLNFYHPRLDQPLTEGLVITIEPFLSTRANRIVEAGDGWTLVTPDGSLCCQFEHTIVVQQDRPLIVTAA